MLQALIAYAERENLGDQDFEAVGVRWLIPLDSNGKLAGGPIPLIENPSDKKPRPKRLTRPKSDPDFVSHGRSYFLCDSLERCLLYVDDADKLVKRRLNQNYFIGLLEEAAKSCASEADRLGAVARFLRSEDEMTKLHAHFKANKASGGDNAAFAVNGVELLKSDDLARFWREKSERQRAEEETPEAMCLATGKVGPVCRTTGFIKLLGEDTKLISFNKECPAFESFGLSQGANAPVSAMAEVRFRSALNFLIEKSRQQMLVFNNAIFLHWSRTPMVLDPIDPVVSGDPDLVAKLCASVKDGQQVVGLETDAYYCLSLSGNGTRVVVRDWLESTVPRVARSVADWFQHLAICDSDGDRVRQEFGLWSLLASLVPRKDGKPDFEKLPPQLPTELLHAALAGRTEAKTQLVPLPQTALAAAIRRQQVEFRNPDDKFDPKLNPARLALIKACLLRSPTETSAQKEAMTESLNPNSRDPAYLCGRLFAVFDRLQELGLPGVGAGVVQRFYASASSTPALVMGRLFRNAQFHLDKVEARLGGGTSENVRKDFEAITCALGDKFPPSLTLEEQGRFALGYYQQKAEYRRRTTERREADANHQTN